MKRVDYKTSKVVDFKKLYAFLEGFVITCQNDEIKTIFYISESLEQLQINIQDSIVASEFFFRKLKTCADMADHYIELEKFVIYMELLLGKNYTPFKQYKKKLLNVILRHTQDYFTSDEYCVIRHLLPLERYSLEDIIALGHRNIKEINEGDQYFTCEIYLIEGQYKQADLLLQQVEMDGILLDYQNDYQHYKRKLVWQQLFKSHHSTKSLQPSFA